MNAVQNSIETLQQTFDVNAEHSEQEWSQYNADLTELQNASTLTERRYNIFFEMNENENEEINTILQKMNQELNGLTENFSRPENQSEEEMANCSNLLDEIRNKYSADLEQVSADEELANALAIAENQINKARNIVDLSNKGNEIIALMRIYAEIPEPTEEERNEFQENLQNLQNKYYGILGNLYS